MTYYSDEVIKILKGSEKEANILNHPFVGSEHLILSVLKIDNSVKQLFNDYGVSYISFLNKLKSYNNTCCNKFTLTYTPLLKRIISSSVHENELDLKDLVLTLLEENEGIALSILNSLKININELYNAIKQNDTCLEYGICLNDSKYLNNINPVVGREKEIKKLIEILCRKNKCNPLLIGEAGVGKTAIVEGLAYMINNKQVPKCMYNKKIIEVNLSSVISNTKYRGEFEEKLNNIIKIFNNNANYILFIDEIHTIVGAGGAEGAIDASNMLKPYLARNNIKCIGSTTIKEYNSSIKRDKALDRRFQSIIINPTNKYETINILNNIKKYYEDYHKVIINDDAIDYIVSISKFIYPTKLDPDRSIDIMDEICTNVSINVRDKDITNIQNKIDYFHTLKDNCLLKNDYTTAKHINNKIICLTKKVFNYTPIIKKSYIKEFFRNSNIKCKEKIGFI